MMAKILRQLDGQELVDFIEEYFDFYNRVFNIENYLDEYAEAILSMQHYLDTRKLDLKQFSTYQTDLIKLGFLNQFTPGQLDRYIQAGLNDDEMEKRYQSI